MKGKRSKRERQRKGERRGRQRERERRGRKRERKTGREIDREKEGRWRNKITMNAWQSQNKQLRKTKHETPNECAPAISSPPSTCSTFLRLPSPLVSLPKLWI